jgi:PhzF family phenazine biosynthesis protein
VRRFRQVDVFGSAPLGGNSVSVVLAAADLSPGEMLAPSRWPILSETTFVLPATEPGADYRVRIFTPATELPFAGHPTLGTAHAWLEAGGQPSGGTEVVQQCGAGLVRVRTVDGRPAFAGPALVRSGPLEQAVLDEVGAALRLAPGDVLDAAWVDNGPGWLALWLADAQAVLAVRPGPLGERYVGVVGPRPPGESAQVEVRAFFPTATGTAEDPVTGSLNASLATWLAATGRVRLPYVASQGTALGRTGRVYLTADADDPEVVWVGGATVTVVAGTLAL